MRVRVNEAMQPGTSFMVQLGDAESSLALDARVVWCERTYQSGELIGLAFEDLTAAQGSLGSLVTELRAKSSWDRA